MILTQRNFGGSTDYHITGHHFTRLMKVAHKILTFKFSQPQKILIPYTIFIIQGTYCENTHTMSPSDKSYGKPPTNSQALFLYWSCQEDFWWPSLSSCSLSFFIFFTFLKHWRKYQIFGIVAITTLHQLVGKPINQLYHNIIIWLKSIQFILSIFKLKVINEIKAKFWMMKC